MIPVARTEKLLIQEVDNELIVYDEEQDTAHCLNPMAVRVWYYCDGQNTVEDIAKLLEKELNIPADSDADMRGLVWLTLEELERFNLIKEYLKQPTGVSNISRRKVIKTASLVGGFAIGSLFPVVKSIVAPAPVMAVSPIPIGNQTCRGMCGMSMPIIWTCPTNKNCNLDCTTNPPRGTCV